MRCKEWTPEEEEFLKRNYFKYTNVELGKIMNRSASSVSSKFRVELINYSTNGLLIVKPKTRREWSKEEVVFLMENYFKYSLKELAEKLNRWEQTVTIKFLRETEELVSERS